MRHAKILATLGPSSWNDDMIRTLIETGANGFRLNFSHGDHERHQNTAEIVRRVSKELNTPIALLQDLQGPKIRVGKMDEPVDLIRDTEFTLDSNEAAGSAERVYLPHPDIFTILHAGDTIFINDGLIRLEVKESAADHVTCIVRNGGTLSSHKGVNIPGRNLPCTALTEKDKRDLQFGLDLDVDWMALSFVQRPSDLEEARELIRAHKPDATVSLMAKIETVSAIENLEEIVELADGIMIARGDLGVELPAEEIPPLQKKIIRLCRKHGKPVVVATQMLESMIQNPSPTRAEVTDIANATYEGADCVMLSAESAAGKYPQAAVEVMARTIARVEKSSAWRPSVDVRRPVADATVNDAITEAACGTAETISASAIVPLTETGHTAIRVSRWRPDLPILVVTPNEKVAHKLNIVWGVKAMVCPQATNEADMENIARDIAKNNNIATKDGKLVVVAGNPFGESGSINFLRVIDVNA